MKDWWGSLQTKERLMAMIAAAVAVIAVLYVAVWSPILEGRENKKMRVENKREVLSWMNQKQQEVEHLKRINPNLFNQAADNQSLLAIIDTGAKQMGIRPSITRIEPNGENKVQVWLEDMSFDNLIVLLGELERRNYIQVEDASLTKSDQIGKVSGKVSISR